jgi:hypothetical protein
MTSATGVRITSPALRSRRTSAAGLIIMIRPAWSMTIRPAVTEYRIELR